MQVRSYAVLLLTVVLVVCSSSIWMPKEIAFSAKVNAERGFEAQLFWCEDEGESFSGGRDRTLAIQVKRGESTLRTLIPAKRISKFRFDFGVNPGEVAMSDVCLSGRNEAILAPDGFKASRGVDRHWTDGLKSLRIVSSGEKDPYVLYAKPLDVVGGITPYGICFKFPIIVLWWMALYLVSRFCVAMCGRIVGRIGDCRRNGIACIDDGGRIVSFDVLRISAFLFVVFCHVLARADAYVVPAAYTLKGFNWGGLGVSFFFVLSGAALSIGSFKESSFWGFYARRLRAILPSFWVAYFVCALCDFAISGNGVMGGDPMKVVQTVFGMDGYLGNQHANYYLVGEWYLGCMLLTYLLAPCIYRSAARAPVSTLAVCFTLAVLSIQFTPALCESLSFWNRRPAFNVLSHVPEFAFGIVFWRFIRPHLKRYLTVAAASSIYLICYLLFAGETTFACSWCGILASVSAFAVLCFLLDMIPVSSSRNVIDLLAKTSFLAFLYHHCLIYWFIRNGVRLDARNLTYEMLLIVSLSFACAYLSLKPVDAIKRLVFDRTR